MANVDHVPSEVWSHILSYLDVPDILNARLVNKALYDASLRKNVAIKLKVFLDRKLPQLYNLQIYSVKIRASRNSLVQYFKYLQDHPVEEIEFFNIDLTADTVNGIVANKRVRKIFFYNCLFSVFEQPMISESVTKVFISECPQITDEKFEMFMHSFPNLNTLGLVNVGVVFYQAVVNRFYPIHNEESRASGDILSYYKLKEMLAKVTNTLRSLIIIDRSAFLHCSILELFDIPNLRLDEINFEMVHCLRRFNMLEALAKQAGTLKKLRVYSGINLTVEKELFERFVQLETCVLKNVYKGNLKFFQIAAQLPKLKTLVVQGSCFNFDLGSDLTNIMASKTVENLGIIDCSLVGNYRVFEEVIKLFPNLKRISFQNSVLHRAYLNIVCSTVRNLQVLVMEGIKNLDDSWFINAPAGISINSLTNLRVLDLSNNRYLSWRTLTSIQLASLQKIFLFSNIDSQSVENFVSNHPGLQCVYSDSYHFCDVQELTESITNVSPSLQRNFLVAPLNKHESGDFNWFNENLYM